MLIAVFPVLLLVLGLLLWALSSKPLPVEAGRIAFFCGLFWLTYVLSGHTVKLLGN